jgi:hypothetical protein
VAAAATYDRAGGHAAVFLTNRGSEPVECTLRHGGFDAFTVRSVSALTTTEAGFTPITTVDTSRRVSTVVLPSESWTVVEAAA